MLYTDKSALIVGAGAVGAVLGAALLAAGWHVTFRVRPESFLGYRRLGLVVRRGPSPGLDPGSGRGARETAIDRERFICDAVARGSHRLVFLCTKMPDFERAIHGLAEDDDGERIYVTTQNGLAAPQMCAALFGKDRVLAGAAVVNAQRTELGVVEVFSDVRRLSLAPLHLAAGPVAREVAARLAQAGIQTQVAPSADGLLWEKFVGLEPLATACAVTQLALGELRAQPIALRFLRGLFDEVFDVAQAAGAELAPDAHVRRWQAYLDGPPAMRPSLAIDVAAGRTGELDWLTGAVVRLAERVRVRAPLHLDAFRMLRPEPVEGLRPAA
ncbi:MAG: 2-dehydropantoate 2-reductase [Betaproteobacteria bacterium]|nr:MAG: 2-dehydropantoate 2-reductase [Betaproteobacteria bacterium]